jgi:uncharacterized protein (DUF4415 family)
MAAMPRKTATDHGSKEPAAGGTAKTAPGRRRAAAPRGAEAPKAPNKVHLSIRLSPGVVAHFKAGGPGWQTRIDDALRKLVGV